MMGIPGEVIWETETAQLDQPVTPFVDPLQLRISLRLLTTILHMEEKYYLISDLPRSHLHDPYGDTIIHLLLNRTPLLPLLYYPISCQTSEVSTSSITGQEATHLPMEHSLLGRRRTLLLRLRNRLRCGKFRRVCRYPHLLLGLSRRKERQRNLMRTSFEVRKSDEQVRFENRLYIKLTKYRLDRSCTSRSSSGSICPQS